MREPAKLEILTRGTGASGFQLHRIESSQAYLLFKPKRLPENEWELVPQPRGPDGSRHYALRYFKRDHYLLLNPKEKFLWEHFDGCHSLSEIAKTFHFQFGSFDYEIVRAFLAKLYLTGLLQEVEGISGFERSHAPSAQSAARWGSFLRWLQARLSFRLMNADRYCTLLYERGGYLLFNRVALWAMVMVAVGALIAALRLAPEAQEMSLRLAARPFLIAVAVAALLPLVSILHVLAHALACKSYGRRVREMGFFLLQGVWPSFYTDVTDIFMSTRRARVIVDLAGPMVELVLGSLAFLSALWMGPGLERALLFGAGVLLWEGALINLYPFTFLELDGYNILADLIAMPTLRRQALSLGASLPRRVRAGVTLHRSDWIQLVYLGLCGISLLVYLWVHLDVVADAIRAWPF